MNKEEIKLLNEMKENCLNGAKYIDPKAMEKYNLLRKLEDENQQLKELLYTKNFEGDAPKIISIFEKADKGRINKLEKILKDLRSWLEDEIIDSKSGSSQYYWFGRVLSKLNELEEVKDEKV